MTTGATTDLFRTENVSVKTEAPAQPMPSSQYLRSVCECGAGGGWRMVQHYDVVVCHCGKRYWAIRPKRNSPLVASLWPGLPGMERQAA
jgi:hypothetical protein